MDYVKYWEIIVWNKLLDCLKLIRTVFDTNSPFKKIPLFLENVLVLSVSLTYTYILLCFLNIFSSYQFEVVFCALPQCSCLTILVCNWPIGNPLTAFSPYRMNTDFGISFCCYFIHISFHPGLWKSGLSWPDSVYLLTLTSTCPTARSHHLATSHKLLLVLR